MKKSITLILFLISFLGGITGWVYNKINDLESQILTLKQKNKKLITKQNEIKNKVIERRKSLEKKKINRTKHKLAKASIGAIPFVGTVAVVGLTYDEIQGYCQDIKDYKNFEESIIGFSNNIQSEEEKALCGYDYDSVKSIVLKDIEDYKNLSEKWFDTQYNTWQKLITDQYDEFIK